MPIRTREFWRSYWFALRRIRKDRRARSFAIRTTLVLLYLLIYVPWFFLWQMTHGEAGPAVMAGFYVLIFASGVSAALLMHGWHRKQDDLLNFSLTGQERSRPADSSGVSVEVRSYLEQRALIIASLLARASSEIGLRDRQLPPGMEVVTRQIQNALLRERGLWNVLEPSEAELARAPDGGWTVEQRNEVICWCEQLRLLRWALGADSELTPLVHSPKIDLSLSYEPMRLGPALQPWEVRVQRDLAMGYVLRVAA
jgi:hypothetical protein